VLWLFLFTKIGFTFGEIAKVLFWAKGLHQKERKE